MALPSGEVRGNDQVKRNVFESLERAVLVREPYPHLIVENALPNDVVDVLLKEMPPVEVFTRGKPPGSNVRFALPSHVAFADGRVSTAWKENIRECRAGMGYVLAHLLTRFRSELLRIAPDFVERFGPMEALRAIPRERPGRKPNEIGVDAQMVINTPALDGGTSVRGPHLDLPDKLLSGLLYLRTADDDSTGGELELYEPASSALTFNPANDTGREGVRLVRRYSYTNNLLVLPLNTPMALHGVSPRGATPRPRYHLHLVGEMSEPLFMLGGKHHRPPPPAVAAP